ncbi:serine/threonine protein kinase [Frankia sp. AiPa1]|uniref:serine/threonine protein kinase n=1 Tax=Frankia sp. AiPa1 TaxID=573492 RepID=UPI00202B3B86|nr:serine/threonine protein kinase [Frankia sp. AiPa1]MCL9758156.1 protein kinase [Frankia sp. AiPa1]
MTNVSMDVGDAIADVGDATERDALDQPGVPLRASDPVVIGDFRVLRRLGEGGMGTVYLGESPFGQPVAIKVIHPESAAVPEFRERFRREMTHARQVAGFCTAEVLDVCPDAELPYLVTEFVPGPTLRTAVTAGGPLLPADLERLGIGMASALTAIHAAGIAHHDLTPSNILLPPAGPRVIDFGIANALGTITPVDEDVALIGTPGYMAPEQFGTGRIGSAADVFAWAAVMVFAATGRPPFGDGAPDAVLHRTLHEEPDLSALPAGMVDLVRRSFQKDPDSRPSAGEILLGLLGETGDDSAPAVARALDGWRAPTGGPATAAEPDAVAATVAEPEPEPEPEPVAEPVAEPESVVVVEPNAEAQAGPAAGAAAETSAHRVARRTRPAADGRSGRRRRAAVLAGAAALLALVATAVPVALGADRAPSSPLNSIGAEAAWQPVVPSQPSHQPNGNGGTPGTGDRAEPARKGLVTSEDIAPPSGVPADNGAVDVNGSPDEAVAVAAEPTNRTYPRQAGTTRPAGTTASRPRAVAPNPATTSPAPQAAASPAPRSVPPPSPSRTTVPSSRRSVPRPSETSAKADPYGSSRSRRGRQDRAPFGWRDIDASYAWYEQQVLLARNAFGAARSHSQ